MRSIIFSLFLCCVYGKFFQEVFVDPSDKVFFFTESFMVYLMNFVNNFFDVIGCKITGSKSAFDNTTFKLLAACGNSVQSRVKRNIQLRRGSIDDS